MIPPPLTAESLLQHAAFVRSVALATLKGADLVDDAVQDTYLAALEHGSTRKGALRPWLGGVARRKAALLLRRRAASRRREAHVARTEIVDDVAEIAARAETGRRLIDAVLGLEEPYRAVFLLRYYEGLPPREIARRLETPVETVSTRIKRGLERLRSVLEEKEGRDWRAALLPLAARPLLKGAAIGAAAGSVAMSKMPIVVGACLLVLLGAAAWFLRFDSIDEKPGHGAPLLAADADDPPADPGAGPKLATNTLTAVVAAYPDADRELDLHGMVVDESGRPIKGAALSTFTLPWMRSTLWPEMARWGEEKNGPTTVSAFDGSFAIRTPRNSRWNLRVRAAGFATKTLSLLRSGERVRVVMRTGVSLEVRLRDAAGKLLSGARVQCARFADNGDVRIRAESETNAEGLAVLDGLVGGYEVRLFATHPAYGMTRRRVTLAETGTTTIDLAMEEGRTVSGVVSDRKTGAPIEGARVGFPWVLAVVTRTDAQGRFELGGWTHEAGSLHVLAAGYAREQVAVPDSGEVDAVLVPGAVVSGRVVTSDGAALAGVPVAATGSMRRGPEQLLSNAFGYTAADGRFTLRGLRPHMAHTLHVTATGHAHRRFPFDPRPDLETLDLGDVQLAAPAQIVGTLRDADGEPVARRELRLDGPITEDRERPHEDREKAFTDDLGRFSFDDLARGTYGLAIKNAPIRRVVQVTQQDLASLDLQLPRDRERCVVVIDDTGRAVEGVRISLSGRNGTIGVEETDASGVACFLATAEPSRFSVQLSTTQRTRYLFPQDSEGSEWPADVREIRVVLRIGRAISGTLVNEDGSPYPHAYVTAKREGKQVASAWSGDEGRFLLQLADGTPVDLLVTGSVQTHFPLRDGVMKVVKRPIGGRLDGIEPGATDVTLTVVAIAANCSLRVLVLDPDGEPFAGAHVLRSNSEAGMRAPQTGADGRVVFENLLPTPLNLHVWVPHAAGHTLSSPPLQNVTPNGQQIVIQLQEMLVVHGHVRLPGDLPAVGAHLSVSTPGVSSTVRTDKEGAFTLVFYPEHLPVTIRAAYTNASGARYEGGVEVRDKSSLPANIRLTPKEE